MIKPMSLDERKCKILGAVVRDYVSTVRPVGSEELAARHAWGVKSATIRNELAELSELGYLRQPHTSAGRIPSDQGYRFYVDHLMLIREVDCPSATAGQPSFTPELDALLRQTCALLSRMTSYTSVATRPRPADTQVVQVFLSAVSGGRLLLVLVLSTGQVQNCLVPDAPELTGPDLVSLGNALNAAFSAKTLDAIHSSEEPPAMAPDFPAPLRPALARLLQAVRQSVGLAINEDNVYLEGASEILRQPEFRDADKLDGVLEALQRRTLLFQTMSRTLLGPEATVVIGTENHVETMRECSVVTAPYYLGTRERGTIGVVGPTRMDYDRAVPAVGFFARTLTQTLTRLGIR